MVIESTDKCRVPPQAFWRALEHLGIRPASVARLARLPASLYLGRQDWITTSQTFAIWRAIEELSGDPGFGIRLVEATAATGHKPAFLAAFYAADYRDALSRVARFKRLCTPEQMQFEERNGQFLLSNTWPTTSEDEPYISIDASFAYLVELGRKGTGRHLTPLRVDFVRPDPRIDAHRRFFACEIRYGAPRNLLVLDASDIDRPFPGHNPELLHLITPALTAALKEIQAHSSISEQIKAILKRTMASGRPEISEVARELGKSERTLQRRITKEGQTFRALLISARQELARHLLADDAMSVGEVAYLLGFQDTSSFYRAFKGWEGITPSRWRDAGNAVRPSPAPPNPNQQE